MAGTAGKISSTKAMIFVVLFALPFAGGGLFGGWLVWSDLSTWAAARLWEPVPAQLLDVELQELRGDDSTSYRVRATYEYDFAGERHRGSRVGLATHADNIGSWHQDTYRELAAARAAGTPVEVHVDPDAPWRSILRPELRWGLLGLKAIFMLVFGIVGFGLLGVAVWGRGELRRDEARRAAHPDEPWRWRSLWSDGRISAQGRGKLLGYSALAALWNLISAPALFFVPDAVADGQWLAALALIFPLVGALLGWGALMMLLRWRRFGASTLELATFPPRLGGRLRARLLTGIPVGQPSATRLQLDCFRLVTSGSGDNRSTRKKILYQDITEIAATVPEPGPRGAMIPIDLDLPSDRPPTSFEDSASSSPVQWELRVRVELAGIDYDAEFELPVAAAATATAAPSARSRAGEVGGPAAAAAERSTRGDARRLLEPRRLNALGIDLNERADGSIELRFDRARHKGVAFGLALFTAVWVSIVAGVLFHGGPWMIALGFGLFVPFLLWGLAEMALVRRTVVADRAGLRVRADGLWQGRERLLAADDVRALTESRGMQAGNRLYWRIRARGADRRDLVLGSEIDDVRTARALAARLRRALEGEESDRAPAPPTEERSSAA